MFQLLPTPEEMARWDRMSMDEYGILEEMLMENASREALAVLLQEFGNLEGKRAVVFAGSGNNGGDAFALARHLANAGSQVLVLHTRLKDEYSGCTGYNLALAQKTRVPLVHLPEYNLDFLSACDICVDGLLGTGFTGELREEYQSWIHFINSMRHKTFVLSLDIPSGLDGKTGTPKPVAVRAHATVTFEEAKLGLWLDNGGTYTGEVHVRAIGIPRRIKEKNPPEHVGLTRKIASLYPHPSRDMHKGTAGHLLVVGGSRGLTGAPVLAGLAGLRSGSGLVTIACPGGVSVEIKAAFPDIMTLPLGRGDIWEESCFEELKERLPFFDGLVLGPGLGRQPAVEGFVRRILDQDNLPPLLVDADGLYWLTQRGDLLDFLPPGSVLTPHPGEMARLLGTKTTSVVQDRIGAAERLRNGRDMVVVHKGAGTLVVAPGKKAVTPFAEPSLAVGGSGDVLSGCIGSLLARRLPPFEASCLGVYWHGFCGKSLASRFPLRGNLAQEIAHTLPDAIKELLDDNSTRDHDRRSYHGHA